MEVEANRRKETVSEERRSNHSYVLEKGGSGGEPGRRDKKKKNEERSRKGASKKKDLETSGPAASKVNTTYPNRIKTIPGHEGSVKEDRSQRKEWKRYPCAAERRQPGEQEREKKGSIRLKASWSKKIDRKEKRK